MEGLQSFLSKNEGLTTTWKSLPHLSSQKGVTENYKRRLYLQLLPLVERKKMEKMFKKLMCRFLGHIWWVVGTNGKDRLFCRRCMKGF